MAKFNDLYVGAKLTNDHFPDEVWTVTAWGKDTRSDGDEFWLVQAPDGEEFCIHQGMASPWEVVNDGAKQREAEGTGS